MTPEPLTIAEAGEKRRLLVDVSSTASAERVSGIRRSVNSLTLALLRIEDRLPLEPVPVWFCYRGYAIFRGVLLFANVDG